MSNLNDEKDYQSFNESLDFILTEFSKRFYISIPALIQSFSAETRRCSVLPAIKVTYEDGSIQSMPIINDVPVIFPSCSNFSIFMPLAAGDSVLLCFCHRGIQNFKDAFKESLPTISFLDLHDAVAIAGFGLINITPADSSSASLQTNDGENAVIISLDKITLKKNTNTVIINDSEMIANISGATLTLSASSLISSVPVTAPAFTIAGGGDITLAGGEVKGASEVTANGIKLTSHKHAAGSYSNSGGAVTGESGTPS